MAQIDIAELMNPVFIAAILGMVLLTFNARQHPNDHHADLFRTLAASCTMIVLVHIGIALSMPFVIVVLLFVIAILLIIVMLWQYIDLHRRSRHPDRISRDNLD